MACRFEYVNRYAVTSGKEKESNPVAWQVHGCVREESVGRRKGRGMDELLSQSLNESMKGENKRNKSLNNSLNTSLNTSLNNSSTIESSFHSSNTSSNTSLNDSSNDGWVCDLLDERSDALWQGGTHTLQFSMNTHAASYQRYRLDFCTLLSPSSPF